MRGGRLLAGSVLAAAWCAPACAAQAYVRFDQLGYETGGAATAYLAVEGQEAGATFSVIRTDGSVAASGAVGASTGSWGAYTIYRMDFAAPAIGRYRIVVSGPIPAQSGTFKVKEPTVLYAQPLANALAFYEAERDGSHYIPGALRTAPAHLNDMAASVYATPATMGERVVGSLVPTGQTIDAGGGWWDAGDYLKFVETHSYAVGMLLTGLRDFPGQMGRGSGADFTGEARFGLNWLLKMWDDTHRQLFYEVGIGIDFEHQSLLSDHDLWRLPQADDTLGGTDPDYLYIQHRPVFAAGPAGAPVSPNLAGRLSAAFALGFLAYKDSDPAFARTCLLAAEHVFDLADTSPAKLLTALPYGFYPETEWRDDMEWGATELDIALALGGSALPAGLPHTDPAFYLTQAANWAHAYITGPNDAADTLNLYDVSGLAHFELYRAIDLAGNPPGIAVSQAELLADLLKQLSMATAQGATDPFGFGVSWATYDTTSHGAGLSVMADEYADLAHLQSWNDTGARWLGNIMGGNIWGLSLIVGDGDRFPDCLQHQVANIMGSLSGGAPVLAGAAVEGPNATGAVATGFLSGMRACPPGGVDRYARFTGNGARFLDNVQNYPNTEPAIDLTAASPLMFAWRVAGAPKPLIPGLILPKARGSAPGPR